MHFTRIARLASTACALLSSVFAGACAKPPSSGRECNGPIGVESVVRRNSKTPSATSMPSIFGALTFRSSSGADERRKVKFAFVRLFGPGLAPEAAEVRRGTASDSGVVHFDSIPAGQYSMYIMGIGYIPVRRSVEVRENGSDTVDVRMRQAGLCLTELRVYSVTFQTGDSAGTPR